MIEIRWLGLMALWTILMAPVFDLAPSASRAQSQRAPSHQVAHASARR